MRMRPVVKRLRWTSRNYLSSLACVQHPTKFFAVLRRKRWMSGFTTWHSEVSTLPSRLQVLHSGPLRSRSAFSQLGWITLYRWSKSSGFSPVVTHNGSKLSLPDPGSALSLCSQLLAFWTHIHTFPSPGLCSRRRKYKGFRSLAVLVTWGWHRQVFSDSTKVFSLLHVYFSVPGHLAFLFLFLFCFVFPRALLSNSSILPLKKTL